ncbi:3-dehydroquinate synthase [Bacillus dakarensis]|uniref:3-dehydroquinate synthase n=1 Tax=Robertmurraya dakarensis TaxID=1926278 RepID=UPI000981119D|nr:3-dehydroquinate synthase [Bacillus dakarensis]
MARVNIRTASKEYPVFVEAGAIHSISTYLDEHFPSITKLVIITDGNVGERYLDTLSSALSTHKPVFHIVPNGESAKTFEVYHECLTFCLEQKLDRKSLVLAFGGGAVGDLAGFVAATFMRGIPFIQLPTTILAHDSAVGGKVAINHPLGKNMIGAFYQPEAVFYDLNLLNTLPSQERRSGFAEVIKHGLIHDHEFYDWLRGNITNLSVLSEEQLSYFLTKGITIKGKIVAEDEKEAGIRAFLNFGHTLGHAIEAEAGYGNITHGEAVVIGMLFALQLSKKIVNLSFNTKELEDWLTKLGYSTILPVNLDNGRLIGRMKQDKKSIGGEISFVLLKEVGHPILYKIDENILMKELNEFVRRG